MKQVGIKATYETVGIREPLVKQQVLISQIWSILSTNTLLLWFYWIFQQLHI